jgi:hypothetical protein
LLRFDPIQNAYPETSRLNPQVTRFLLQTLPIKGELAPFILYTKSHSRCFLCGFSLLPPICELLIKSIGDLKSYTVCAWWSSTKTTLTMFGVLCFEYVSGICLSVCCYNGWRILRFWSVLFCCSVLSIILIFWFNNILFCHCMFVWG